MPDLTPREEAILSLRKIDELLSLSERSLPDRVGPIYIEVAEVLEALAVSIRERSERSYPTVKIWRPHERVMVRR